MFPVVSRSRNGHPLCWCHASSHTLCVFCSSAMGARPEFGDAARLLGQALAKRNIGLVYGGARVGLMGAVADSTMQHGGKVIGVIPHVLVDRELSNEGLTELHVVDTMHTRKALMAERSDAFLVLPGGYGTFEEMFEVLTWQSIRLHTKPVCLLNVSGFYDGLIAFLDTCVSEGVLRPAARANLLLAETVENALDLLTEHVNAGEAATPLRPEATADI
ncbi:TIGR00730 family Rossman fold protein [Terriglobus aquaticus]|uniref:Cytokinin riboside 5'-monophosphate phosphoribohydrolase n=1 Tax=Terriglobus aquaticus TaxID=940139 RepID=A0ABW9KGS5_9BACT